MQKTRQVVEADLAERRFLHRLALLGWNAMFHTIRPLKSGRLIVSITEYPDDKLTGLYCLMEPGQEQLQMAGMQVSTEDLTYPITWPHEDIPTPADAKKIVDDLRRGRAHEIRQKVLLS